MNALNIHSFISADTNIPTLFHKITIKTKNLFIQWKIKTNNNYHILSILSDTTDLSKIILTYQAT